MRGRTNVGDGVALNANVTNRLLKSGQVTAGDFVEYYTEPTAIDQSARLNFRFVANGYLIATAGNILTAFKDGRQVDSYAGYTLTQVGLCGDYVLIYDKKLGIIGVLSIDNDEFTLLDTIETGTIGSESYSGIWGANGKVCLVTFYSSTALRVGIADIANDGTLSNFRMTTISQSAFSLFFIAYYDAFYIISMQHNILKLAIGANNEASLDEVIPWGNHTVNNNRALYRRGPIIVINDNYGTSTNTQDLYVLNFTTGSSSSKRIPENGAIHSIINDSYFLASARTFKGSNIGYWTYKLSLCKFDEETYEITLLDIMSFTEGSGTIINTDTVNMGGIVDDIAYDQCMGGYSSNIAPLDLFEIFNETHLQRISQRDYVLPYSAGNPVGVAQTNGVANDIIPVYIPTASQ